MRKGIGVLDGGSNAPGNYALIYIALVAPLSRGIITINSSDISDPPIINPNWLSSETDQKLNIQAFKMARALFNTTAIKPILRGPELAPGEAVQSDEEILDFIMGNTGTLFHASRTCAMGRANDTMAVIDSRARVIGVSGLRVVDASSFPILPPGHPTSTICEYQLCWLGGGELINSRRCISGEDRG